MAKIRLQDLDYLQDTYQPKVEKIKRKKPKKEENNTKKKGSREK